MKYACLIYETGKLIDEQRDMAESVYAEYGKLAQEAAARNAMTGGAELTGTGSATTVRMRDGKRVITDGPYAETKEVLTGFMIFECASLDEALDWAARIPSARWGSVEVRPVLEH